MLVRPSRAIRGHPSLERARTRFGGWVQDENGDCGHRRSLRAGGVALGRRVRAYIGLGANVGRPERALEAGIHALAALPDVRLRGVSSLYATAPVGVTDQAEFRNAVAAVDVPAGPDPATGALALLLALKAIERAFGRRDRRRWGPRELDLDLLMFGRHRVAVDRPEEARSSDPTKPTDLVVPHRDAAERLFVLAPWSDVAAGLVPPGWSETVGTARKRREAVEGPAAVHPVGRWDPVGESWVDDVQVPR